VAFLRPKNGTGPEPNSAWQVLTPASPSCKEEIAMRSKLAISAIAIAALVGATAIASAQMQPAPGASGESKAATDTVKSTKTPGTTTGSATRAHTNKGVLPNPSFQDNRDAGTGRGK
jgi:hypothetical protein